MHYYYPEHLNGYDVIRAEGKSAWDELHGAKGFKDFSSRDFLDTIIPTLSFSTPCPSVLEYGCGTGPGACFLAERGFSVRGIDLIPTAIDMAREIAEKWQLDIQYEVADICNLHNKWDTFDMIVDSYCLQCIVFDEERQRVFSSVQSNLKEDGYYLVSSAVLDEAHEQMIGSETIRDHNSGVVYTKYGSGIIDLGTGIVLNPLDQDAREYPDAIHMENRWYLPNRRHLNPAAIEAELVAAGFEIILHDQEHPGNLVCKLSAP